MAAMGTLRSNACASGVLSGRLLSLPELKSDSAAALGVLLGCRLGEPTPLLLERVGDSVLGVLIFCGLGEPTL